MNKEVREQLTGYNKFFYQLGQTGRSEYRIGTPVSVSTGDGTLKYTVSKSTSAISNKQETSSYYRLDNGSYTRVYVSSTKKEEIILGNGSITFVYSIYYKNQNGEFKQIGDSVSVKLTMVFGIAGSETLTIGNNLNTISATALSDSKYLIVSDNFAVNAGSSLSIAGIETIREYEPLYSYIYTRSGNNLTKGSETHAVSIQLGEIVYATADYTVGTLTLNGVNKFHLYPLTEEQNAYYMLTFTLYNDVNYQRQYVTSVPFVEDTSITTNTNSNLPANSGEAPQAPAMTEATNPTEVATVPPTTENGDDT
jgi:hypothetical protein